MATTTPPLGKPERRKGAERRHVADRRMEVRFVPGRDSDRRGGKDRRRWRGGNTPTP